MISGAMIRRVGVAYPDGIRQVTVLRMSVRWLSLRERVGLLRRDYPGLSWAAAARLVRARGAVGYETWIGM